MRPHRPRGEGETVIDINEEIALKLRWKPPGHKDTKAYRKRNCWGRDGLEWLSPDGTRCVIPPLFDTDPAASMELLRQCNGANQYRFGDEWIVQCQLHTGDWWHTGNAPTLEAAIAEAWLAAMEAKDA